MKKILFTALLALLVVILSSCGDYLTSRGQALNNVAIARRTAAEADRTLAEAERARAAGEADAQRKQAEALLSAAEANKEVSEASADVLRANANMPVLVMIFAGLAVLTISGLAMFAIWFRTPAPQPAAPVINVTLPPGLVDPRRAGLRLETPTGIVMLEPQPGETRRAYLNRCEITAQLLGAGDWQRAGRRLLPDGR